MIKLLNTYVSCTIILLFLIVLISLSKLEGASFYVSYNATKNGNGSFASPWELQKALDHPTQLQPGDTVWIRGGRYLGQDSTGGVNGICYTCHTNGSESQPIIFRNYQNERVTLDGKSNGIILNLGSNCSYTWFWGLEVMSSSTAPREYTNDPGHPNRGNISCTAPSIKFINMILHDGADGIDIWIGSKNAELYGCVIYNNGWDIAGSGHGHGIYTQNDTSGTIKLHDNIFFSSFGYNVRVWSTGRTIDNYDIQGNIIFNGGSCSENKNGDTRTHNFFIVPNNPNAPCKNLVVKHNFTFSGTNMPRPPVNAFGLNYGTVDMTLDSNILTCQTRIGGTGVKLLGTTSVKGNKILGGIHPTKGYYLWGFTADDFPENDYSETLPTTGLQYFIRINKYETGRAHLVIYNWENSPSVKIDISNIGLKSGERIAVINVTDLYSDTLNYIYNGNDLIDVPMTGHSAAQAIGSTKKPVSQFPGFGVFIIQKSGSIINNTLHSVGKSILVSVSPNPFNHCTNFKVTNMNHEIFMLSIYDHLGKLMHMERFQNPEFSICKEKLPNGIYSYQIQNNLGTSIKNGLLCVY
ncbi:MAG: T9SS type A sorting domain-containing protein [Saprospiraceae bacterium]|nr:T9SS type A sorting domain-containing protein [Candidatus Vicinibacter affinis]